MKKQLSCIFVGGPGRSGTTLVARGLADHPAVASLPDVELKVFCEANGLLDLRDTLTNRYSPTRAITAVRQFREVFQALVDGNYGQAPLTVHGARGAWDSVAERFIATLHLDGFPVETAPAEFDEKAARFVRDLAQIACSGKSGANVFLEKTPGNLLFADTIELFAPGSRYVHVMRDPRAIASSLLRIMWGPDTIEGAARWVISYALAWRSAAMRLAAAGIEPVELYLEDIVAAPDEQSRRATRALGLSRTSELFDDASPTPMDRPIGEVPPEHLDYLTRVFADWLPHFGYAADGVGVRMPARGGSGSDRPSG